MNLEFEKATDSIVPYNILNKLNKFKSIIVFGAGQSGEWVVNLLREHEIIPTIFCDNYADKWGKERVGLRIESFENAIKLFPDAAICVASMWSEDIIKQIKEYDEMLLDRTWDLLLTMAWETTNKCYLSEERKYIKKNIDRFRTLYNSFSDEESKKVLKGLLNYRLTRDKKFLSSIKSQEITYFDLSVIKKDKKKDAINGTIIDGGHLTEILLSHSFNFGVMIVD